MRDTGRPYKNEARRASEERLTENARERKRRLRTMLYLIAATVGMALLYYSLNAIFAYAFLFFYGAAILLGFAYVLANRGFSRDGLSVDSLAPTIPLDERKRYLRERDSRRESTKWMLMLLIPLFLVIGMDILYLFWGEHFMNLFRSLK